MARYSAAMFNCIREIDVKRAMGIWKSERPNAAQPENEYQATMMLHYARARMPSMPEQLRFYSHSWLINNGFPSELPDELKPKAQRMYPILAGAVGVSSGSLGGRKSAFNYAIDKVMSDAVLETHADGYKLDSPIVKHRILEMRALFKKRA